MQQPGPQKVVNSAAGGGLKWVAGLAIGCITVLEIFAMAHGVDGTALAGAIAVIAGLGGYVAARA